MIRIERDPQFWADVAELPAIAPTLFGLTGGDVGAVAAMASTKPIAIEAGALLFCCWCNWSFIWEMNTFVPSADQGARVRHDLAEALNLIFEEASVIIEFEIEGNPRTGLLQSAGASLESDWKDCPGRGRGRLWILTKARWDGSQERRLCLN
jgi:hypothetical protein